MKPLKPHRRSLMERLHEVEPITEYADTAFKGTMEPKSIPPRIKRRPSASTVMPNGTRCHEYLALDTHPDAFKRINSEHTDRPKHRFGLIMERLRARDKVEMPRGLIVYSWNFTVSYVVSLFRALFMVGSWMLLIAYTIMTPLTWLMSGEINLAAELEVFLILLLVPATYLILRIIDDLELATWLDSDPSATVIFRRDLGVVVMHRWFKKTPLIVPFAEIQGVNQLVAYNTVSSGYILVVRHKHSKVSQSATQKLSELADGFWLWILDWEIIQHYMDVTRPLPDIPRFEPYRHLDPVTKAWDEKHQRPRWLWRDMDPEEYLKLARASSKAAQAYPFERYRDPDPEKVKEWKPAGDGKHWYQLG